jgi:phenol hydroxylase P2 protein
MNVGLELDGSGGQLVEAVVKAITDENDQATVERYPGYVRVTAPDRIVISREALARHHPYQIDLTDLQVYASSYFGDIEEWSDEVIRIQWEDDVEAMEVAP